MKDEKIKKIEEEMIKIDSLIDDKKSEIKSLRDDKYFLNQMKNNLDRMEEKYQFLIHKNDEKKDEENDEKKDEE